MSTGGGPGGQHDAGRQAALARVRDLLQVRQCREYTDEPVAAADLQELLQVARWSGSSQNKQPWHFLVVTDRDALREISADRDSIAWVADVPVAIALVFDGRQEPDESFDQGRVTERLLIAAKLLGLGAGTAWVGGPASQARVKATLAVPDDKTLRAVVAVGHPRPGATHRLGRRTSGRKPLDEIVSYEQYGRSAP